MQTDRHATVHEVEEAPRYVAAIWEGYRIVDTHEAESQEEAEAWTRAHGLEAEVMQ